MHKRGAFMCVRIFGVCLFHTTSAYARARLARDMRVPIDQHTCRESNVHDETESDPPGDKVTGTIASRTVLTWSNVGVPDCTGSIELENSDF